MPNNAPKIDQCRGINGGTSGILYPWELYIVAVLVAKKLVKNRSMQG